jgi:AraC-like DNA-binding protein
VKTVEALQLVQMLARCESLGANPAALRRSASLEETQLADIDGRLPWQAVLQVLDQAERDTGDPLLALRAGRLGVTRGLLVYQFRAQRSLKDALMLLSRNISLAADPVRLELREGTRQARVVLGVEDVERDSSPPFLEYLLAVILCFLESAGKDFRPLSLSFPHAPRGPIADYERLLGARVRFREAECVIAMSPNALAAPIPSENAAVARMVGEAIDLRIAAKSSFRASVEVVLADLLRSTEAATRSSAARRLGVSVRTLQRRLDAEGHTFRDLRESVLRSAATSLLERRSLSLTEIAGRLGFAGEDAFAKAWKRWTGETPSDSRRRSHPRSV